MKIVKLDAINSTNSYLKKIAKEKRVENWTVVWTDCQTQGRGQMQNKWESEPGKNLTFSVLIKFENLQVDQQYYLNFAVANAIFKVLKSQDVPELYIKWPNDIMSVSKKVCGILIENNLMLDLVQHSVVGIGLNVNQEVFSKANDKAGSLKQIVKKTFKLEELLISLVSQLKREVALITSGKKENVYQFYQENLYQIAKPCKYQSQSETFIGTILGVNSNGQLLMRKDGVLKTYNNKEITFL